MPARARPAGRRHRLVPPLPGPAPVLDEPRADARDAHLLARRRGGGRGEEVLREAREEARRSSAARSIAGRQVEVKTVGSANTASSTSAGWIDISSPIATPRRRIQPQVEKTDMYMWSSTNTWLRSTESRSRYSGRSWWAMVAIEACSRATCASSAIVTLSRKRRCTRVLTVVRNQVAVADTPSARADRQQQAPVGPQHALAQELEPQRQQRVGQRGELRQRERGRASGAARGGSRASAPATSTAGRAAAGQARTS